MIQPNKEQLLLREIQLLAVRERRDAEKESSLSVNWKHRACIRKEDSAPCGMSVTEYTSGLEKGKLTELRKYEGTLGQIQATEDVFLTRVQARQVRKQSRCCISLVMTMQNWN